VIPRLRLVSHDLCPYVQRAVIVAAEKGISFERVDIDLASKPAWFLAISPTGKTPLLEVEGAGVLFESAVIAEYLDEIAGDSLLPEHPFERARHRAWVELASATLNEIGRLYSAANCSDFDAAAASLIARMGQIDREVAGPWFGGEKFGLVDAAFAPAFRYLDVFRTRSGPDLLAGSPTTRQWAQRLASRPSVRNAVRANYADRLVDFIRRKNSCLGQMLKDTELAA
jgi:glutathione S-transferase